MTNPNTRGAGRAALPPVMTVAVVAGTALQRWRQLALVVGAAWLFGLGVSFLLPKKYVASASFLGTSGTALRLPANLGALAGIAGQLGILPSLDAGGLSPQFYSALVTTDAMLEQLAVTPFPDSRVRGVSLRRLAAILGVGGRTTRDSVERAVRKLRGAFVVDVNQSTGIVSFRFEARHAYLAEAVADSLLAQLHVFITQNLRIQAGAQRRFLQERLGAIEREVQQKQDALRQFYESNRNWQNAPSLVFREAILRRDLEIKQDIYLSVARALEEARINEVKDTPLLTVIDRPRAPARPRQPKPLLNAFILAFFAPVVWLAWLLWRPAVPGNADRAPAP